MPRYSDTPDEEGPDTFILSGAEDLVPIDPRKDPVLDPADEYGVVRYRPRTEGLFARVERWARRSDGDSHWRVLTRDNILSIYGRSPDARVADPTGGQRIFSWLLEETRDDRGNVIRYVYKAEDGAGVELESPSESGRFERVDGGRPAFRATAQRYLKRIHYGNRRPVARDEAAPTSEDDWLFEAVFDYGEHGAAEYGPELPEADPPTPAEVRPWPLRSDPFSTYRATFEVRSYRLCRRVLMFHRIAEPGSEPCLVSATEFTYQNDPILTQLHTVTQVGYKCDTQTADYERATLPALELGYIQPEIHDELQVLEAGSLDGLTAGVEGGGTQWLDLDSEGIPGVLVSTPGAWLFKANLGAGRLAPPALLRSLPSPADGVGGSQQLMDLGGDGRLDLVQYAFPLAGYFERTPEGNWAPFVALNNLPNIDWNDPNLRFLDLDGDGLPDLLITEQDAFVWYRSRAKEGFEPATFVPKPRTERDGPAIVFADATETIHLADMSGDGLTDLVRVRSGEVCYWPNLGHGRFGRKITLRQSPAFDSPDQFDPRRIRFADVNGSGTSDILYLGRRGVSLYFNESGNGLSQERRITAVPPVDGLASLEVVDLLGTGTACLVWSSVAPGDSSQPIAYVDILGGKKPYLLDSVVNNLGGETRLAYTSSTQFYLRDKAEGRPWLTRLPFPVHVLERVERIDHVARSKMVTLFRYHHGFFDGYEREFRGFASVGQWDAESFGTEKGRGLFSEALYPVDEELTLPPVHTKTWFHTGAWLDRERLELALAKEYYGLDPEAPLLPDTTLPTDLTVREEQEAARALRGQILRQEIYAEDGKEESIHPYSVSERDYEVRLLQRAAGSGHAVFFVHARHTVDLHYERRPSDPRMSQTVVLALDDFGNVTRAAAVAYPRRAPVEPEQGRLAVALTEAAFANRSEEGDWYRIGVPVSTTTSEITGLVAPARGIFSVAELDAAAASAVEIAYEASADGVSVERRLLARSRPLYYREYADVAGYRDDPLGPLPAGAISRHALVHHTIKQAFTPGLLAKAYGGRVTEDLLRSEGRYVKVDGAWWARSGRVIVDPAKFYLPVETEDPFGQRSEAMYDGYSLLVVELKDPVGNRTSCENDYRVLAPWKVTDANGNETAAAFDALGRVVRTAVMGKPGAGEGDTLDDPTTRIEYDPHRWKTSSGTLPAFTRTRAREQHRVPDTRWQEAYVYTDGSGREAMTKGRVAPGPETPSGGERWVGTGRTIFDNKGNPVKKYEPFFSSTFEYETETALVEKGVTSILRYDPLGRLVRTDLPDGTFVRVDFDAWKQESWDANDTVLESRWHQERPRSLLLEAHANTPLISHLDAQGRPFLAIEDNGARGQYKTRTDLDVLGKTLAVIDARGNRAEARVYDLLGRPLHVASADAGNTWMLPDVSDSPIRQWDARGHTFRNTYDELRRPTGLFVRQGDGAERAAERLFYGERHPEAEAKNLRGRVVHQLDGAGLATSDAYDFKGNVVRGSRKLAREFRADLDWVSPDAVKVGAVSAVFAALLEEESFETSTVYDALNRPVSVRTPDGSRTDRVFDDGGRLLRVDVALRGAAVATPFVLDIEYDEKGQRRSIAYGNGATTSYEYDPRTFRLVQLTTTRGRDGGRLQDLHYEYDPVGNITEIVDSATILENAGVSGNGVYEYDALHRLVKATGREHPTIAGPPDHREMEGVPFAHPNDGQALRRYVEEYDYDPLGNFLEVRHRPRRDAEPDEWSVDAAV